jgi:hypothetical protein
MLGAVLPYRGNPTEKFLPQGRYVLTSTWKVRKEKNYITVSAKSTTNKAKPKPCIQIQILRKPKTNEGFFLFSFSVLFF